MQSVVTGQAPITLERKNASGGKQIKLKIRHKRNTITETKSYTSDTNTKVRSAYVCIYQVRIKIRIISYAKRVAADTETEPRRPHGTH